MPPACYADFMKTILYAVLLAVAGPAAAGMYKCTNPQGAVEFSDKPCIGARAVEAVQVQDNRISGGGQSATPHSDQLTALVMKAVASKDYRKARELAVTERHWALINEAERFDAQACLEAAKVRAARRPTVCNTVGSSSTIGVGSYTSGSYQGTTYCN